MNARQSFLNSTENVGILPRSINSEFEKEEKKIQNFESANKKFYKDVKSYCDKLDELVKSEAKLITNMSNLTGPLADSNQELAQKSTKLRDQLNERAKSSDQLKQTCLSSVIEPMKNLNSVFPHVYQSVKRREQYLKDLHKQQDKLYKLQDREHTGSNLVKINEQTQIVNQSKQLFMKEHSFLMRELPLLYSSGLEYVRPCVNSLIKSQENFYKEYGKFYESEIDKSSGPSYENSNNLEQDIQSLSEDIEKCLSDIKSLSIVASD
ncbi:Bridging integrator 3 [Brachionus plicatilis]|uniref:Bridging integrator 3 n=1 Tax=Brachionus plicatilis TaxID=10195 RepID=A0A3M7QNP3_BRAPC|nr:Bridging integrator 3 [Brachionus plicatilis]